MPFCTPKGLHSSAQGRAAHPGEEIPLYVYPERVVQPFQGRGGWFDLVPGCAATRAEECNPFGVKNGTAIRSSFRACGKRDRRRQPRWDVCLVIMGLLWLGRAAQVELPKVVRMISGAVTGRTPPVECC